MISNQEVSRLRILQSLFLLIIYSIINLVSASPVLIKGVRVWPSPDNVRVVFDLDNAVDYKLFFLEQPCRVVVDFSNALLTTKLEELDLTNTHINKIRSSKKNQVNIELFLN